VSGRTIVGSGPYRRPLPLGREAVERALGMCRFWGSTSPWYASTEATKQCGLEGAGRADSVPMWLPIALYCEHVDELHERLRGYP
jgi:hypothetical protein